MTQPRPSYRWMEHLLELLIERYDRDTALTLLHDSAARAGAIAQLTRELEGSGLPAGTLETAAGQNLFVAVLTLRIKFAPDDARERVRLNIAMREGRA